MLRVIEDYAYIPGHTDTLVDGDFVIICSSCPHSEHCFILFRENPERPFDLVVQLECPTSEHEGRLGEFSWILIQVENPLRVRTVRLISRFVGETFKPLIKYWIGKRKTAPVSEKPKSSEVCAFSFSVK